LGGGIQQLCLPQGRTKCHLPVPTLVHPLAGTCAANLTDLHGGKKENDGVCLQFGKAAPPDVKLPFFDTVYKYLEESLASGDSPFTGALFWRWENNDSESDPNTVYNEDEVSR
jgi:hypothetical protein